MQNILENYGLNEKETQVYLAALEIGEATGFEIYKKTDLKKPTVYYILDELQKRKLVHLTTKGKKRYFVAENPERIKKDLEEKLHSFEDLLPQLRTLYNLKVAKPQLRFHEGKGGLKEVYNDTLKYRGEILAFASEKILHVLGQDFSEKYVAKRVKHGISVRAIVPSSETMDKIYIQKNMIELRAAKIVDAKNYNFPIEINIYANKISMISFRDEIGLIIESDEISRMMRMMFEFFWSSL
jgi:sugar-specific transcriptional regulator TrmB